MAEAKATPGFLRCASLNDVEAAWLQLDGRWVLRLAGRLELMTYFGSSNEEKLVYVPPGTATGSPLTGVAKDACFGLFRELLSPFAA